MQISIGGTKRAAIENRAGAGILPGADTQMGSRYRHTQNSQMCFLARAWRAVLAGLVFIAFSPGSVRGQAETSTIAGTVIDAQRHPVANAKISVKDPSGKILNEAVTDAEGRYCLENLAGGRYELMLEPPQTGFQGETVVASVGPKDLSVDWVISASAKAIAVAMPGTLSCEAFTLSPAAKTIIGGSFASAWLGSLVAIIIGVSKNRRTASSSQ